MATVSLTPSNDISYSVSGSVYDIPTATTIVKGQISNGKGSSNWSFEVEWDLSSVSGTTFTQAYVTMFGQATSAGTTVNMYRVSSGPWSESSQVGGGPTYDMATQYGNVSITSTTAASYTVIPDAAPFHTLAGQWKSGAVNNYGVGSPYNGETSLSGVVFNSKDFGSNEPTLVLSYTAVPDAPTGFSATASGSILSVSTTWTAPATGDTPTGYKVDRATNSGFTTGLTTTDVGNTTSWPDSTVAAGTTYWYRVRAYDSAGDGANSSSSSTTTLAVPDAPTNLFAIPQQPSGITNVLLNWTVPGTGGAVSTYKIERAPDSAGSPGLYAQIANPAGTGTSYTDSGALAVTTVYWYRVRGTNGAGDGAYSGAISMTTAAQGAIWLKQFKCPGFTTSTNPTITLDATPTAGNLVIVCLRSLEPTPANITDPTGYTRRTSDLIANLTAIMVERVTQGGDSATITFTDASSVSNEMVALEFVNAAIINEFDLASAGSNAPTNVTSVQPGTLAPSVINELLVGFVAHPTGGFTSPAVDSSFILIPRTDRSHIAYKVKGSTQSAENPTFSWTTAQNATAIMAAFNPSAVAAYFGLSVGLSKAAGASVSTAAVQF